MAGPLAKAGLDATQIGQIGAFLVEQIFDHRHIRDLPDAIKQPFGDVPLFAHKDQQLPLAPQRAFRLPEARGEAASDPATSRQELVKAPPLVRDLEAHPLGRIEIPQPRLERRCAGADLAREQEILTEQQIVMIVVERHRHPVVREHQEGQGAAVNLSLRDQMAHEGLEECLIGNPGRAEKAHHVAAAARERKDLLDGAAAQAPPLAADLDLEILRNLALETQPFLQVAGGIEQALVVAFIEEMPIDQPVFLHPRLDPVAFEEIETLDIIPVGGIQKGMGIFGRLDRHAVARQHVEMRGPRKGIHRRLHGGQRGPDKRPFSPAAFDPASGKGDVGIVPQCIADLAVMHIAGAPIEMDRHEVTHSRQTLRLRDDRFGVLVAQKNECNSRHSGNHKPLVTDMR